MSEHTFAISRRSFVAGTAALAGAAALGVAASPVESLAVTAAEKQAEAQAALVQLEAMQGTLD